VPTADFYEQRAADCFKVAAETNDASAKAILLESVRKH